MKRRVAYISGKITGDPYYKLKFARFARYYENLGFEVINPVDYDSERVMPWVWYICRDLYMMWRKKITHIVMLPDWVESPGAQIEMIAASMKFGAEVIFEED